MRDEASRLSAFTIIELPVVSGGERRAFTIVELMVVIAITVLLMLAINKMFSTASDAVRMGVATHEVIDTSRMIGPQIDDDAEEMIGPDEGGFIVIVNNVINTVHRHPDDKERNFSSDVRSDQILFFRERKSLEPQAPSSTASFDPASPTNAASYVRVFYGHGMRTDPDGTGPSLPSGLGNGPNEFAINWVLARHALFLDPDIRDVVGPAPEQLDYVWFSDGARWSNPILEYDGGADNPPSTDLSPAQLNHGLTDVAARALEGETDADGIISFNNDTGADDFVLFVDLPPTDSNPSTYSYQERALRYMFVSGRIRVNATPMTYDSWRVAQLHPYFVGHVSDFEVAFAGDYDGLLGIDREGGTTGRIVWYDMDNPPTSGFNDVVPTPIFTTSGLPAAADAAFVFRHGLGDTRWPYLIRIRARVHDTQGTLAGRSGDLGRWIEVIIPVDRP